MIITNTHGLSAAWVRWAERFKTHYDRVGWRSITDLIKPPQIVMLERRHEAEIETDIMDLRHAMLGDAMHAQLQENAPLAAITEQRYIITIAGKEISFKPDIGESIELENDRQGVVLEDYKICKAYAVKNVKMDWHHQLNAYAYGFRKRNIDVVKLGIWAFLKDWDWLEAQKDQRYPQTGIVHLDVPMMGTQQILSYLEGRIQIHLQADEAADDDLPECTMEERWAEPDRFAVKKQGGKVALPNATFLTRSQAEAYVKDRKGNEPEFQEDIEFRPGLSKRCIGSGDFKGCPVRNWCRQWRESINPAF